MPLNQKVVEANKDWAKDAKTLVSNGPFKFTDYKIKDQIVLEKNENYTDKDKVKLNKITMKMVTENTSAWASYKSGQFDMVDSVPTSEIVKAVQDKTATLRRSPPGGCRDWGRRRGCWRSERCRAAPSHRRRDGSNSPWAEARSPAAGSTVGEGRAGRRAWPWVAIRVSMSDLTAAPGFAPPPPACWPRGGWRPTAPGPPASAPGARSRSCASG